MVLLAAENPACALSPVKTRTREQREDSNQQLMAKKKKTSQLSLKIGLDDERIPKLLGVLFLFISIYLLIAFSSYLFTWRMDQDRVLRFSWRLLLESGMDMENWLGRLGAIVSNLFFYWLFGLPSLLFVYLGWKFGINRLYRRPIASFLPTLNYFLVIILVASILLEFVSGPAAEFPWGGAFGSAVSEWLRSFLGTLGLLVLLLAIVVGLVVWRRNPNFNTLTLDQLVDDVALSFSELFRSKRRPVQPSAAAEMPPQPSPLPAADADPFHPVIINPREREELVLQPTPQGSQLSIELEQPAAAEAGPSAAAELEITPLPQREAAEAPVPPQTTSVQQDNPDHTEPYDPTLDLSLYEFPVTPLLDDYSDQQIEVDRAELEANKNQIIETLLNYKIEITKIRATIGPTVTLYEIIPAPGVRISKIKNLEDDIALSLSALGIRIIAPIPGKGTIGIEVPNKKKQMVSMREVLMSDKFKKAKMDLPVALGKTISNEVFVADLAKMPHLLVAGATGQGKSVGINAILISLLYKKHPSQVKLVLIDPKKVELFPYSRLDNHFLAFLPGQEEPITTETTKVIHTLNSLCIEMDQRYDLLKKAGTRNIKEYNEKFVQRHLSPLKGHRFLPFIVLIIDEFADLIMTAGKEVELPIARLAQLARAVGIHLVIATQRPSVNIITGVIKANFPARIAYKVTAKVDSRTILDGGGADQLIGRGDMLLSVGGEMVRIQGAFIDTPEVERVIDFIAKQQGYPEPYWLPEYHADEEMQGSSSLSYADLDDMFEEAARLIVQQQHGSTSMIQRRMKLGYNRAGRIMDQLEGMGIVGPSDGSKAREVLIYDEMELERYLQELRNRR